MRTGATTIAMCLLLSGTAGAQSLGETDARGTLVVADLAVGMRQYPSLLGAPGQHAAVVVPTLFARTRVLGREMTPLERGLRVDVEIAARGYAGQAADGAMRASPGNPELAARFGGHIGQGWVWLHLGLTLPLSGALDGSVSRPAVERFAIATAGALDPQLVLTSTMSPSVGVFASHRGDWDYESFDFDVAFAFPIGAGYGTVIAGHTGFVLALHHWGATLGVRVAGVLMTESIPGRPGLDTAMFQPFVRYSLGVPFIELHGAWHLFQPYGVLGGDSLMTLGFAVGAASD